MHQSNETFLFAAHPQCFNLASSPKVRPAVHQIKDLSRIEQLLEATQEFHSLVVTTFGVDKDQEGTGTWWGTGGLPETYGRVIVFGWNWDFTKITKLFLQSFREIYFLRATPLICLSNQLSLHGEEEVVWFIFVTLDAGQCAPASYSHYKFGVYVYFSHCVVHLNVLPNGVLLNPQWWT